MRKTILFICLLLLLNCSGRTEFYGDYAYSDKSSNLILGVNPSGKYQLTMSKHLGSDMVVASTISSGTYKTSNDELILTEKLTQRIFSLKIKEEGFEPNGEIRLKNDNQEVILSRGFYLVRGYHENGVIKCDGPRNFKGDRCGLWGRYDNDGNLIETKEYGRCDAKP